MVISLSSTNRTSQQHLIQITPRIWNMSLSSFQEAVFTWVSFPIIGFSFSVSSAGSSFSARLFSKESGPGILLLHQTLSPSDWIYTCGFMCHFHICKCEWVWGHWSSPKLYILHGPLSCTPETLLTTYLTCLQIKLLTSSIPQNFKKHKTTKKITSKFHFWLFSPSHTTFTPLVSPVDSTTKNIPQFKPLPINSTVTIVGQATVISPEEHSNGFCSWQSHQIMSNREKHNFTKGNQTAAIKRGRMRRYAAKGNK